jgi:hypothetical protein
MNLFQPLDCQVLDISTAEFYLPHGFLIKNDTSVSVQLAVSFVNNASDASVNTVFLPGWNNDQIQRVYKKNGFPATTLKYCTLP